MADQPRVDPDLVKALEELGGGPPQPPLPPRPKPKVLTSASRVLPRPSPPESPKEPPTSDPLSAQKPPATTPSEPTMRPISTPGAPPAPISARDLPAAPNSARHAPPAPIATPVAPKTRPPPNAPTPASPAVPPATPASPAAPAPPHSLAPARPHLPSSTVPPAAPRTPESRFRCLHCGYQLISANGFRCSECGTEYERHVLERWFWGAEESRMDRVLWLVRACVFMKLWVLWDYRALAYIASAAAAGWACWIAGEGKRRTTAWQFAVGGITARTAPRHAPRTTAWQFAVGGMVMAALVIISAWWSNHFKPTTPVSFEVAAAGLLLGAMLRDEDRQKLWREPAGSRIGLALILAAPLLAIGFRTFEEVLMPALRESAMEASLGTFAWNLLEYWVPVLIPHACAFFAWVVVWFWMARMRRAMFITTGHGE